MPKLFYGLRHFMWGLIEQATHNTTVTKLNKKDQSRREHFPAGDLLIVLVLSLSKRDLFHRELWRVVENCILPCRWHLGSNGRIYAVFP
jgi:hypothetical protein|tara:strand:+ start:527 stop:793 length:267 start_codon:yes stop_codon:yes gene_type:complete